ncbi:MAG: pitrilysin family protein [Pseudomonadota bacterium]
MRRLLVSLCCALIVLSPLGESQALSDVEIPYRKEVLGNGLTLIVHEDHSAPQVFVSVYYKVGSRDERPGITGFAHLFEHLMFNGTENYDFDFFQPLQEAGAAFLNGDTFFDRTRYYQIVPSTALDRVLWLESERMGHLLGAVTEEKLTQQRGVVQNEKRQWENRPYTKVIDLQLKGLFPEGHPYRWSAMGSMEDLNAASLEDVKSWFNRFYGAKNAVLVVAGDVDFDSVLQSVRLHFGDISSGPPVDRLDDWVPDRRINTSETVQDRGRQIQITRGWVAPGRDHRESIAVEFAGRILAGGPGSRLHKVLVDDEKIATQVSFSPRKHDLASMPTVRILLAPGANYDDALVLIDRELRNLTVDGTNADELDLARARVTSQTIKNLEFLDTRGFLLAESEFYLGSPGAYNLVHTWIDQLTPEEVQRAADRWLMQGYHQSIALPHTGLTVAENGADRTQIPEVSDFPSAVAPGVEDLQLSNGIKVRFVKRDGVPTVQMAARFYLGAADLRAENAIPGAEDLVLSLLQKGTTARNEEQIRRALLLTGSEFSGSVDLDQTVFKFSTLSANLEESISVFADLLINPAFGSDQLEIEKNATIAALQASLTDPSKLSRRYLQNLVYADHAYAVSPPTEADIQSLTPRYLADLHQRWIRPEHLMIFVVGDTNEAELLSALEDSFGSWSATDKTSIPKTPIGNSPQQSPSRVVLFDVPGASQSSIIAAQQISPPFSERHEALSLADNIFGGSFNSRINNNIREEKGWSYGVQSGAQPREGVRIWSMWGQVQSDKTAAAIAELLIEHEAISGDKPFTAEELRVAQQETVRRVPSVTATSGGVLDYLLRNALMNRPDDDLEHRQDAYGEVTVSDLNQAFRANFNSDHLLWIVAGDLSKFENEVRELDIGPVEIRTADGEMAQ